MSEKLIDDCSRCGREIESMEEVGYLGPVDRDDDSCHPFMKFETVCVECEEASGKRCSNGNLEV